MKYKRILLKISGEVLGGAHGDWVDPDALDEVCDEIEGVVKKGIQVAIVVGGGNFWRYRDNKSMVLSRSTSDALGMMATMMNARLLEETLQRRGIKVKALAAHGQPYFVDDYSPEKGKDLLATKTVVVLGGGTGNPYFTTDTAAALRALELDCNVLLKSTKVDGIYDSDPVKNKKAKFFESITYDEVLKRKLEVMDLSSILLCKENNLPVHVFSGQKKGNLLKVVTGKKLGSLIF
ncbi:MAG: UMP kinase [Candidatus Gracilibacteria bacterium]